VNPKRHANPGLSEEHSGSLRDLKSAIVSHWKKASRLAVKRIAVFGAGGATGREVLHHGVRAGFDLCAIDRTPPDEADRLAGVTYRDADVLEDDLAEVMANCDAVISTLGVAFTPKMAVSSPPPLYTEGTRRILKAMERTGIERIAVISAAFVIDQPNLPLWFKASVVPALHSILDQMREMERLLEDKPRLDWTAVRPGWLIDKPASGELLVEEEFFPEQAFRCRPGDLGAFLVDCVANARQIHRKPAVGAPEEEQFESPLALGKAFADL